MGKRPLVISLIAVFGIAFAIRLHFALTCTAIPGYSDMAWYNEVARQHGFPRDLPPGYPLFLRAIYGVFGAANYKAVFVIQGLISALSAALVCWIAQRIGNLKAGVIAGVVAAIYPNLIVYNLTTLTETIGVFFVLALLGILAAGMGDRTRAILTAATILLAGAFRPVILFFAPGVFFALKKRLVFVAALAIVIVPVATYELTRGTTFHRAAVALYETYYPTLSGSGYINPKDTELGSDTLASRVYLEAAWKNIRKDGWRVVGNIYNKGGIMFSRGYDTFVMDPLLRGTGSASPLIEAAETAAPDPTASAPPVSDNVAYVMTYAYLPVMLLGFVGMARLYGRGTRRLVLPALSYVILVIRFSIFKFRYRLPVEPVFIIFAALLLCRASPAAGAAEPLPAPGAGHSSAARDWAIVAGIFLVALVLRLRLSLAYQPQSSSLDALQVEDLARHGGFGWSTPPLYPIFLRPFFAIFRAAGVHAATIAQSVIGACIVAPIYLTARRLGGRRAGFIAAGIAAVYPGFMGYGLGTRTDWLAVMLAAILMAVGTARFAARALSAVSGALAGLATLLRPEMIWLAPGAILAARRRLFFALLLVATLVPYTTVIALRTHRIEPAYYPGLYQVSLWNLAPSKWWVTAGVLYDNANEVLTRGPIAGDPGGFGSMPDKSTWGRYSYVAIMLLGFIGLARFYRREHAAAALPVLLYVVILVVVSAFDIRWRVLLEPLLIVYAAMLLAGGRNGL